MITPGIISQPAADYHASDAVSNSRLSALRAPEGCPAIYCALHIDKTRAEEETPAMVLGSITHRILLEPETVESAWHEKPEGMTFTTKEGKAWREEHQGRPIITNEQGSAMRGMLRSVMAHPAARKIIANSDRERSAYADDKGMLLKARFDLVPRWEGADFIADIKTCLSSDNESAGVTAYKMGYHRQAAFYLRVANLLGLKRTRFVFIWVEKEPPYLVNVAEMDPELVAAGETDIRRDLQVLRNCFAENKWPGRGDSISMFSAPRWALKEIEALSAA